MFHRIASLSVLALLCTLPLTAIAQTRHVTVQTGDLNLTTDAGRAQLRDRIAMAANTACAVYDDRMTEKARAQAYASCTDAARAGAKVRADALVAAALSGRKMADNGMTVPSPR